MTDSIPDSIDDCPPGTGPAGQLAHPDAIKHTERLQRKFYQVGQHAWCFVGNGLSNQTFIEGPGGIIAVDSGESVEEMRAALALLREHTQAPIAACIYSHFHYVNGTQALMEEPTTTDLQIYGHAGIEANLQRFGGEVAPRSGRGIVHQFGTLLPSDGPDALLHCGLGRFFRNPEHAPFTPGYIPAHHTFTGPLKTKIAGLTVKMTPAPSDANDSITIWIPELNLCVNNLIWPSLFNIYAIRGEEYRDPRVLLQGIDEISALAPEHLIGTHGPPLSGEAVGPAVLDFRDAIQFIWDQTVRGINQGLTLSELTQQVQLPARFKRSYFTCQFYGLVEHHVRQIHSGLFGWLDEDETHLFPLPDEIRCARLIDGFGGLDAVRQQVDEAIAAADWRWAAELAGWLTKIPDGAAEDRQRLATVLRQIAQHTPSANVRNWCLTRALSLEGQVSLARFKGHRFRYAEVMAAAPIRFIPVLRVLLDPGRAIDINEHLAWRFPSGACAGLELRGGVAVPTDGRSADLSLHLSHETWAQVLGDKLNLWQGVEQGLISIDGDESHVRRFFAAFDHTGFAD